MSRGKHTRADKVTVRKATPLPRATVSLEGATCPLCGGALRLGDRVTVAAGKLAHREGDPRCAPTVGGRK